MVILLLTETWTEIPQIGTAWPHPLSTSRCQPISSFTLFVVNIGALRKAINHYNIVACVFQWLYSLRVLLVGRYVYTLKRFPCIILFLRFRITSRHSKIRNLLFFLLWSYKKYFNLISKSNFVNRLLLHLPWATA